MATRARKPKQQKPDDTLLAAMSYVLPAALEKPQDDNTSFVLLRNNFAIMTNGVATLAAPIEESFDMAAQPHKLHAALNAAAAQGPVTLIQESQEKLTVKSGKFAARVYCVHPDTLYEVQPDAPVGNLAPSVFEGMAMVAPIVKENAQRVIMASVWLRAGTVVATDGVTAFEFWHGIDFPTGGFIVPRASVNLILAANKQKPFTRFGFGQYSVTFYTDDGCWLKTQLYADKYPNIDNVFRQVVGPVVPISEELATAIKAVEPFSLAGVVRLDHGIVESHPSKAEYAVADLVMDEPAYLPGEPLLKALPHVQTWSITPRTNVLLYGTTFRAAIAQTRSKDAI